MLCDNCGKNTATTHIRSVVNGKSTERHLCAECAAKEGIGTIGNMGLDSMLASMFGDVLTLNPAGASVRCKCCGSTFSDIAKSGKAGCPECYETFKSEFLPYLKRVHGSVKHIGKTLPGSAPKAGSSEDTAETLKAELQKLIAEEKFEQAAIVRDRIKEMEAEK
ncbi:MAG: UvrB/UvrC motif-containing protein [Clostridia bacterium]|nr:UvrB/UvrC motif-containing protein [Clostridia bacterium]